MRDKLGQESKQLAAKLRELQAKVDGYERLLGSAREAVTQEEAVALLYNELSAEAQWRLLQSILQAGAESAFSELSGGALLPLEARSATLKRLVTHHTEAQKRELCATIGVRSDGVSPDAFIAAKSVLEKLGDGESETEQLLGTLNLPALGGLVQPIFDAVGTVEKRAMLVDMVTCMPQKQVRSHRAPRQPPTDPPDILAPRPSPHPVPPAPDSRPSPHPHTPSLVPPHALTPVPDSRPWSGSCVCLPSYIRYMILHERAM